MSLDTHAAAGPARRVVWIVEDEPGPADLAVELCALNGVLPRLFRSPAPLLDALHEGEEPAAIVLDWRLERELSAAVYMTLRHRFPGLRAVFWTGSPARTLPSMILSDPAACLVDKAAGARAFEEALAWALEGDRSDE